MGPTPWTDLERIHHWWTTADRDTTVSRSAWLAALRGAGLSEDDAEPIVVELSVLNALDVVRWAADTHPLRLAEFVPRSAEAVRRGLAALGLDRR